MFIAAGALLVTQRPGIRIPENFEHGRHAFFVKDDLSDLHETISFCLSSEERRREIAGAGRRHLMERHTTRKRAEYILRILTDDRD